MGVLFWEVSMLNKIKMDLSRMSKQEKVILISLILCFINPYALLIFISIVSILELKNNLLQDIKTQPGYKLLYLFILIWLIVSIFHKNLIGIVNMLGYLILFVYMVVYRKYISKEVIVYIFEITIWMSILVNIAGLFQFKYYSNLKGYSFFDFKVQNSPKRRITVGYWNANFYAMMIEFTVICCMARFVQCKKIMAKCLYVCIGLFNIFLMYLTGCRAAFMPFVIFVPVFLFLSKEKGWGWLSIICIIGFGILLVFYPNIIPRSSDVSTVESRIKIWTCAINGLKDYPLFGQGPQAYNLIYPVYNGHKAVHAHNLYLDILINFGIVGTGILLSFVYCMMKDVMKMFKWKENPEYFASAISFIIVLLIHGTMDVTINMPCTAFLFLLVLNMSALPYTKERIVFPINKD